ncbi:hypothetical protein G9A89_009635 [Geosiphon pyriformis]|nr:hypothetical protein G9A89_009635 [Geosiphon pyriformis]
MYSGRILLKKTDLVMSDPPEVIGRGGMGEIYRGLFRGKVVAVKRSEADLESLLAEYATISKLQSPHIITFYGVHKHLSRISLVIEYAPNGDLASYLQKNHLSWPTKSKICHDVALGLMYCHKHNVVHFDLKTENVLLTQDLIPKLSDFGVSKEKEDLALAENKAGGTLAWVAPERVCVEPTIRRFFQEFPTLSDVYSFGLILWSVALDGRTPYNQKSNDFIRKEKRRRDHTVDLLNQLPYATPTIFRNLIDNLTKYEPNQRGKLTLARLELEELYDEDDDDVIHKASKTMRSLDLYDLSSEDEVELEVDDNGDNSNQNYSQKSNFTNPTTSSESITSDSVISSTAETLIESYKTINSTGSIGTLVDTPSSSVASINQSDPLLADKNSIESDPPKNFFDDKLLEPLLTPEQVELLSSITKIIYETYQLGFIKSTSAINQQLRKFPNIIKPEEILPSYITLLQSTIVDSEQVPNLETQRIQFSAGWLYEIGYRTKKDYTKALDWYLKAAEAGNGDAQYRAGIFYADSYGIEKKNLLLARRWLEKAIQSGHEKAYQKFTSLR